LIEAGANVNYVLEGHSILYGACQEGHTAVVKALLAAGANPNTVSLNGFSPLLHVSELGHTEIAKALLEAGADTELKTFVDGVTALYLACQFNHPAIVKALIDAGANVNNAKPDGSLPLHIP